MSLIDIKKRTLPPVPWTEGDNIPWDDPEFSRRMLDFHLAQDSDMASRRFSIIDRHVDWIHNELLEGRATNILDLCCGPGLYMHRLARLGHRGMGFDYSPASIEHAIKAAKEEGLSIEFAQKDIRKADYGSGLDLIMMIFGEFNVFTPDSAREIIRKSCEALNPGGFVLFEVHTFDQIHEIGSLPSTWYSAETGLFSDKPHLCLDESFWDEASRTATRRFFIVNSESGEVAPYAVTYQAYSDDEYISMFEDCGLEDVKFNPGFHTDDPDSNQGHLVLTGRKPAR